MRSVINELEHRGLVDAVTSPELGKALKEPVSLYLGFDPTADSLHLGNLLGIVVLGWFHRYGHRPIALVGGATGLIGDPSGKSHERPLLTPQQLQVNLKGIQRDLEAVLGSQHVAIVNNYDWFRKIGFIDFLRDIGKTFRLGPMLGKEMVRSRLASEEGLSYTEFSYQLLQAYDFLHLFEEERTVLQIGGSDQWGNITAGTELVRKLRGAQVYGLTFPLLTRADGKKFGKTEEGTIWLSPDRLSTYEFYQYLVRIPDADVIRLMRMLTFMTLEEIGDWEDQMGARDYIPNSAQKRLAAEITEMVHGPEAVASALRVTEAVKPGVLDAVLTVDVLEALAPKMPLVELPVSRIAEVQLLGLLVDVGLAKSKGEARRLVQGGGVSLNNQRVTEVDRIVTMEDLVDGRLALLGVGKKRKVLLRALHSA